MFIVKVSFPQLSNLRFTGVKLHVHFCTEVNSGFSARIINFEVISRFFRIDDLIVLSYVN